MSFLFLGWNVYNLTNTPMISKAQSPIIIQLDKSASAHQFVNQLENKQLISSARLLLLIIRFEGLSHRLKAGIYQITPGESALHLLNRVIAGDVLTQNFTIIAGTTQKKVAQDLISAPYLNYNPEDWNDVMKDYLNAEGFLLADTYQYHGGSSSKTLLTQANQNLIHYVTDAWAHKSPNLPYETPYELLIAASIIEKESAIPQERKLISGVIVNRLRKRMPLQMDPTVIYGLGSKYKGKLSHGDLQDESPYNSYRYKGLPPTPIAMVGKEAIDAAAHPQMSNYLYFVAKGDGSHQFSETYEQQRRAINQSRKKGS
jgi:UPF0755 protein